MFDFLFTFTFMFILYFYFKFLFTFVFMLMYDIYDAFILMICNFLFKIITKII